MERGAAILLCWSQLDSREGSTHPRGVGGGEWGEALVMHDACLLRATPWSPGAGLCTGHRDPPCRVLLSWDRSLAGPCTQRGPLGTPAECSSCPLASCGSCRTVCPRAPSAREEIAPVTRERGRRY